MKLKQSKTDKNRRIKFKVQCEILTLKLGFNKKAVAGLGLELEQTCSLLGVCSDIGSIKTEHCFSMFSFSPITSAHSTVHCDIQNHRGTYRMRTTPSLKDYTKLTTVSVETKNPQPCRKLHNTLGITVISEIKLKCCLLQF